MKPGPSRDAKTLQLKDFRGVYLRVEVSSAGRMIYSRCLGCINLILMFERLRLGALEPWWGD
jgi:hypothetical protein